MNALSGSKRIIDALAKYDILTFEDVIFHLPRRYLVQNYADDYNMNTNDQVLLLLTLEEVPSLFVTKNTKLNIIRFKGKSSNGIIYSLLAYNMNHLLYSLSTIGMVFSVYGKITLKNREIRVTKIYPRVLREEEHVIPIYSLPGNVANYEFSRIVVKAFKHVNIVSNVPESLVAQNMLISRQKALNLVHFPFILDDVFKGLNALKYEEGLEYFTKLLLIKRVNSVLVNSTKQIVNLKDANEFVKSLPFTLTKEQLKAVREIGYDMNKETLMYRLLQGDVGSGKTIVSFVALYINYLRHAQGVLLAPTESLAKQHYDSLRFYFKNFPLRIALLTGSLADKEKKEIKAQIERGEIDIIVGTHALFSENITYPSLELVVIDEQQKFGVNQRQTLLNKGEKADLLLMSATPIPQTLASIIYGGNDISTIMGFPHAGREVETKIVANVRKDIFNIVDQSLAENRQVYVIAPKISHGKKTNVESLYEVFAKHYGTKVSKLHGQQNSEEKDVSLSNFNSGTTPILVATSVVEVGIDVKNAGLMIIFEPQSFGLSSLHQLRGRIGRDGKKAQLLLVNDEEEISEKLEKFAIETDGFKIAELDLSLRGPGELTGEKQSGLPSFMYLNIIKDLPLIQTIKIDAQHIIDHPENPEYAKYLNTIEKGTLK